jgi:hypothetical protein
MEMTITLFDLKEFRTSTDNYLRWLKGGTQFFLEDPKGWETVWLKHFETEGPVFGSTGQLRHCETNFRFFGYN